MHINGTIVPHTLIDLGAAINVMTKDTMLKLNLQGSLRKTTTVLQLADRSTVTPEGIVEDVMVSIDSWEYPADFLVLQPKAKLTGYPLILGKPWLATSRCLHQLQSWEHDHQEWAYVQAVNPIPSCSTLLEHDLPFGWRRRKKMKFILHQLYALETTMGGRQQDEDDLIENLIQSPTPSTLPLEEIVRET